MSKILDNTTGAPIVISDTGITVDNVTDYTIPQQDYDLWAASSDIITEIGAGNIVVNDGSFDLSISDGTDLIKDIFPKQIKLLGDTDDTKIGNVGDRLKVDAIVADSVAPSDSVIYGIVEATNGGSKEMDVNGSVTPVVFTIAPPSGVVWYVFELGITIEDSGTNKYNDFGGIAGGLTNGLLIEQVVNSTSYTLTNAQTNKDLVETFSDHFFKGQSTAFINSSNFFTGKVELRTPLTLVGDNSDEIKVTVRDNLTGLNLLRVNLEYMRIV